MKLGNSNARISFYPLVRYRLPRSFYACDALELAPKLIGCYVVHRLSPIRIGRIVEVEAYRGPDDAACHARVGLTKRTKTLLGEEGHAYIFRIYGMYDCLNVVCGSKGWGHAVLIRGVEPVLGFPEGKRTDGPGRVCNALGITKDDDGCTLVGEALYLLPRTSSPVIQTSARVGVAYAGAYAEQPWRFLDASSPHVSRPPSRMIGLGNQTGENRSNTNPFRL
ncbi:DNA-3-methyladenine glycosylase [Pajaroellobacter abortibovis]|uniref:Putative 3-methyladenine DNA glycosylase n=1 Tax=Pajaroellobacter abortibovis TaxID=1882918 RepID=A0A1L6MWL6_9BACT|nr:DNA-3-methyladenine glycosylase [Pajaroellobacter abortibovis]APR99926.1 hypothetical protein BCY86_03955 [Pajaroellobacter abortibovis]